MVETNENVPSSQYCFFSLQKQWYGFNRNINSQMELGLLFLVIVVLLWWYDNICLIK